MIGKFIAILLVVLAFAGLFCLVHISSPNYEIEQLNQAMAQQVFNMQQKVKHANMNSGNWNAIDESICDGMAISIQQERISDTTTKITQRDCIYGTKRIWFNTLNATGDYQTVIFDNSV